MSNNGFSVGISQDKEIMEQARRMLTSVAKGMETALARAANRTAQGTKTQMVRHARARFDITAGDVRKTLWVKKAKVGGNAESEVVSRGRPTPIKRFKVTPKAPSAGQGKSPSRRRRVRISVGKKSVVLDRAFVARMRSGYVGVFQRRRRGSLRQLYGPSTPQMLRSKAVTQAIEATARDRFKRELAHQVEWILKKNGG